MLEMLGTGISTMLHFIMDNIVIINIILSLIIVFFERRSPQAVWTWLLLLYFIPIVGFILYLVIGQDFHKSRICSPAAGRDDLQKAAKAGKSGT